MDQTERLQTLGLVLSSASCQGMQGRRTMRVIKETVASLVGAVGGSALGSRVGIILRSPYFVMEFRECYECLVS